MSRPPEERLPPARVLSHLGVMGIVAVVMGVITAGLAIPFAGALGIGAQEVAKTMDKLPQELETEPLAQRTKILDADGGTMAIIYDQNRINVSLKHVSRKMTEAIVSIEDYRFYEHGALDLKGTMRAFLKNKATGEQVQGGSSITQQMVKLTLIQQAKNKEERLAATDDTYARKIRELRYAIAIEEQHTKDWILERYLNIAYFGDGAYGVQAAARHYFNTDAKRLSLRQSAMLAGLVRNPNGYDPTRYPDKALERRNIVLQRMADLHVITQAEADRVKGKKLGLKVQTDNNGCLDFSAQFFCDYVLAYLYQDKDLGKNLKQRKQLLKTGGLTIHTTMNPKYQAAAERSVANHVYPTDSAVGALALVEPGTGDVMALAQSRPMGFDAKKGETFVNYAIPREYGGSSGFQARLDVQGVHAGGRAAAGSPAQLHDRVAQQDPGQHFRVHRLRQRAHRLRPLRRPQLHDERVQDALHRHPRVGQHLLPAARGGHRTLRAVQAGPQDGGQPHPPEADEGQPVRRAGPLASPSGCRTPARSRWPRPTPPSARAASTATAGRSRASTMPTATR